MTRAMVGHIAVALIGASTVCLISWVVAIEAARLLHRHNLRRLERRDNLDRLVQGLTDAGAHVRVIKR